ncbi:hypothetical protein M0R45_016702 [Rubus argutus]|uniref:Uncharacterized protein n=1 Tax=Rubus argutus TaxID=59490 RepID=A0AAW1XTE5_RUBAR
MATTVSRLDRCGSRMSDHLTMYIGLHAMAIDPRNPNYICTGGADVYARVYDIRTLSQNASRNIDKLVDTFAPQHMNDNYAMNCIHITGLAYSNLSELLVSYSDELIYLFQKNMGLGPSLASVPPEDLQKHNKPQVFFGHRNLDALKGVKFFGPNDDYVLRGSSCGHIFIWKKNGAKLIRVIMGDARTLNQVEPHPHLPILATCGAEKNVKLWAPIENDTPPFPCNIEKIVESNRRGRDQFRNWLSCTSSGDSLF